MLPTQRKSRRQPTSVLLLLLLHNQLFLGPFFSIVFCFFLDFGSQCFCFVRPLSPRLPSLFVSLVALSLLCLLSSFAPPRHVQVPHAEWCEMTRVLGGFYRGEGHPKLSQHFHNTPKTFATLSQHAKHSFATLSKQFRQQFRKFLIFLMRKTLSELSDAYCALIEHHKMSGRMASFRQQKTTQHKVFVLQLFSAVSVSLLIVFVVLVLPRRCVSICGLGG